MYVATLLPWATRVGETTCRSGDDSRPGMSSAAEMPKQTTEYFYCLYLSIMTNLVQYNDLFNGGSSGDRGVRERQSFESVRSAVCISRDDGVDGSGGGEGGGVGVQGSGGGQGGVSQDDGGGAEEGVVGLRQSLHTVEVETLANVVEVEALHGRPTRTGGPQSAGRRALVCLSVALRGMGFRVKGLGFGV